VGNQDDDGLAGGVNASCQHEKHHPRLFPRSPVPTYKSMEWEYPAYYDLTTKPVRQHPIPTYSEDPDEAGVYWMSVTSWRLEQEQRELRRRIVAALRARAAIIESPLMAPC
jgi:hypothetical protein